MPNTLITFLLLLCLCISCGTACIRTVAEVVFGMFVMLSVVTGIIFEVII